MSTTVQETSLPLSETTTTPTVAVPESSTVVVSESTSNAVEAPTTESKQDKSKTKPKSKSNLKVKSSSVKKTVGSVGLRNKNKTKLRQVVGFKGPTLRRLARRGGVKRISNKVYDTVNGVAVNLLEDIVRSSMIVSNHAGRKMISLKDVLYTLNQKNSSLYGF